MIRDVTERSHDYGTCVYAMSLAATMTFYYVASYLGTTGFQASGADLDILKRTRRYKQGFRITNYTNLLYPQYWTKEHFPGAMDLLKDNLVELQKAAKGELVKDTDTMHPEVKKHLEWIVSLSPKEKKDD
jgi:hypothetical protein